MPHTLAQQTKCLDVNKLLPFWLACSPFSLTMSECRRAGLFTSLRFDWNTITISMKWHLKYAWYALYADTSPWQVYQFAGENSPESRRSIAAGIWQMPPQRCELFRWGCWVDNWSSARKEYRRTHKKREIFSVYIWHRHSCSALMTTAHASDEIIFGCNFRWTERRARSTLNAAHCHWIIIM